MEWWCQRSGGESRRLSAALNAWRIFSYGGKACPLTAAGSMQRYYEMVREDEL